MTIEVFEDKTNDTINFLIEISTLDIRKIKDLKSLNILRHGNISEILLELAVLAEQQRQEGPSMEEIRYIASQMADSTLEFLKNMGEKE